MGMGPGIGGSVPSAWPGAGFKVSASSPEIRNGQAHRPDLRSAPSLPGDGQLSVPVRYGSTTSSTLPVAMAPWANLVHPPSGHGPLGQPGTASLCHSGTPLGFTSPAG
jgi:hypothetical protein